MENFHYISLGFENFRKKLQILKMTICWTCFWRRKPYINKKGELKHRNYCFCIPIPICC